MGKADLLVIGTDFVHEYDGEVHRNKVAAPHRPAPGAGLGRHDYVRRGYTLDDLLNHPVVMMHEIDRALGRPHKLRRMQRWRRLVDNSLYSEAGRRASAEPLARAMGVFDWSRTA